MGPKAPEEGGRGPQRPPRPGRRRPGCSAEPDPRSSNLGSRPPALATRHGARAPGPRTLTRPRRRRRRPHRRPGTRKVGGNAAPPRLSLPAPPLAPRPPPAARAALPGPAPGPGRPRAVTPPGGAARRARLGAKREAGSRGRVGAELGAVPFISQASSRDAGRRLRARRARAPRPGLREQVGRESAAQGQGPSPSLRLPIVRAQATSDSHGIVDEAIFGTRNFSGTCF